MKKMLLATALALLITGCAQQTPYCLKQTGSSTKGNHHPSFLRFELGEKKINDAAKICGGAENVVKTETQQTFGLLGFYYFRHLYPLKRVYAHTGMSCPSIWATYLHCSLIYQVLPVVFA